MSIKGVILDKRISLGSVISAIFVCGGMLWALSARDADLKQIRKESDDYRLRIVTLERHAAEEDANARGVATALAYIKQSLDEIKVTLDRLRDRK